MEDYFARLGAVLLDLEDPGTVLHRTPDWIMQPEEYYEIEGYYRGVCFPCGAVVIDGTLFVYYGGADMYCAVATCSLDELVHQNTYSSRSDIIRVAVGDLLKRELWTKKI
jgi:predicted GH43/DUF377 family glycosyl hydrolase